MWQEFFNIKEKIKQLNKTNKQISINNKKNMNLITFFNLSWINVNDELIIINWNACMVLIELHLDTWIKHADFEYQTAYFLFFIKDIRINVLFSFSSLIILFVICIKVLIILLVKSFILIINTNDGEIVLCVEHQYLFLKVFYSMNVN